MASIADQREKAAERQQRQRDRARRDGTVTDRDASRIVTPSNAGVTVEPYNADAESDADTENTHKPKAPDGAQADDQKPKAKRQPNILLEALVQACGGDTTQTTKGAWSRANKDLTEIRQVCPNLTPAQIEAKAKAYRAMHPDWTLTTGALAKHWGSLNGNHSAVIKTGKGMSEQEIVSFCQG
jgi:hypothetical protein